MCAAFRETIAFPASSISTVGGRFTRGVVGIRTEYNPWMKAMSIFPEAICDTRMSDGL